MPPGGGSFSLRGMHPRHCRAFFVLFHAVVSMAFLTGGGPNLLAATPLALHPANPHYFLFRGRPTLLITSGEHYGAVLNRDFNFAKYLDTLAADGLNLTRTFSGAYCEPVGAFNIAQNTLAPAPGRFLAPWRRSDQPGYAGGGNKFDLTQWDTDYFQRLRAFVGHAARRGVVVEMNLFCPFYEESMWRLSPMNAANNVNGIGVVARTNAYVLGAEPALLAVQERMVRRIVEELRGFDNLYYEICNEPYFGGVTLAWQRYIADVISTTEGPRGPRHLISQNIANGRARVENPHPAVSIFNFHYATPPDTVAMNYGLGKVIGDNETGFNGTNDLAYRVEAWNFLLAGGGLFNNLDYSFVAGHEDGTFVYPGNQPGGGNPAYRRQLRVLGDFLRGFDFVRMAPAPDAVRGGVPAGQSARVLAEPGRAYALYLSVPAKSPKPGETHPPVSATLELALSQATYRVEWVQPDTGEVIPAANLVHQGGVARLTTPSYTTDLALRLIRVARLWE